MMNDTDRLLTSTYQEEGKPDGHWALTMIIHGVVYIDGSQNGWSV
jgi:hypothetical protein